MEMAPPGWQVLMQSTIPGNLDLACQRCPPVNSPHYYCNTITYLPQTQELKIRRGTERNLLERDFFRVLVLGLSMKYVYILLEKCLWFFIYFFQFEFFKFLFQKE